MQGRIAWPVRHFDLRSINIGNTTSARSTDATARSLLYIVHVIGYSLDDLAEPQMTLCVRNWK